MNHYPHDVGVAVVLFNERGNVLLLERADSAVHALPGGRLENETPADGVCRELKEETGLILDPTSIHQVTFAPGLNGQDRFIMLYFAAVISDCSGVVANTEPDKHKSVGWHSFANLPGQMWPRDVSAIEHAYAWFTH